MTLEYFIKTMTISLIATIVIESLVALLLGVKNKKDYINIVLVNIMTNPVVNITPSIFLLLYGMIGHNIALIILEISVVIIEGLVYKKYLSYNKINPYLLSLILNISSYVIFYIISILI